MPMHHRESLASAERVVGRIKDLSLVRRGFHRRELHAALILERPRRKQPFADDIVEARLVQIEQERTAAAIVGLIRIRPEALGEFDDERGFRQSIWP